MDSELPTEADEVRRIDGMNLERRPTPLEPLASETVACTYLRYVLAETLALLSEGLCMPRPTNTVQGHGALSLLFLDLS
jgi:hypothetical protein